VKSNVAVAGGPGFEVPGSGVAQQEYPISPA